MKEITNFSINKNQLFFFLITLVVEIGIIASYFTSPLGKEIVTLNFILTLIFIIKFRNRLPILVMFLFFMLYNAAAIEVYYQDKIFSFFRYFNDVEISNRTFLIHSLFIFSFGNMINIPKQYQVIDFDKYAYSSKYIFIGLTLIGIYMLLFGIQGTNMLQSGEFGTSTKSSLHEYYILLFFLQLLVRPVKNRWIYNVVVFSMYFYYCLKTVLFGGRIEAMEITILLLLYFWLLTKKENKWLLGGLAIIAYYFSNLVSKIRSNPLAFLKGDFIEYLNPFYSPSITIDQKVLANNQGDVVQASNRLLALIDAGHLPVIVRIKSFFVMLASVFVPSNSVPDYANLASYHQIYPFNSGGGGLISSYYFVWMGYFGPIFIGAFLGYFISKGFNPKVNIGYKIYAVILIVMSPRWFAYGPILIVKLCFLTVVMYAFTKLLFDHFFKRTNNGFTPLSN